MRRRACTGKYQVSVSKTSVVADNKDLADSAQVEQRRVQWRAALEGLRQHLGG